jgi:hypothetical protein
MSAASGIAMGNSSVEQGKASAKFGKLSDACAQRVVDWLRRRHPHKTAEAVAAETGLAADRVRKWLELGVSPSLAAFLALVAAYGPDFLGAAMARPPNWLRDAAVAQERAQLAAMQAALAARQAELEKRAAS